MAGSPPQAPAGATPAVTPSSSDSFVDDASRKLMWLHDSVDGGCASTPNSSPCSEAREGGQEGTPSVVGDADAIKGAQERVWGESLQLGSRQDAQLVIDQLRLNMSEGSRCALAACTCAYCFIVNC